MSQRTIDCATPLKVGDTTYRYYSLDAAAKALGDLSQLPLSLRVLLENLLRHQDGVSVQYDDLKAIADWQELRRSSREIQFRPARVLMQDFTGVPALVDLAAMRDAVAKTGADAELINPLSAVDLVIDHSVMVDRFANSAAFGDNVALEVERNKERYAFLRWGQKAFQNFRVVPPGTGICHQVNLEYLAKVAWTEEKGDDTLVYPDTLVGTDSHTTMINGLGVLGWGVGGIEAEAAMLGQPVSMLLPEVVGFKLVGHMPEGCTATDLVLTVTQMLRAKGVVGKFVEFFGEGLAHLPLADRATIANMSPEFGATCGFFPVDEETIKYLELSGRSEQQIKLVEAYAKAQGLWRDDEQPLAFSDVLELDLATVKPVMAGPKRPQDKVALPDIKATMELEISQAIDPSRKVPVEGMKHQLTHGDLVIAAITSCTNTSNPSVMMAAGLLAKNAIEAGLNVKPWVKTSLAPGSKVVTDYLDKAGLTSYLEQLGFHLVGYGCTTCIGNSGPLPDAIAKAVDEGDLTVSAVLSGNRNFEGRIHPQVKGNWLASPPLVVAYALAGTTSIDITSESLGEGSEGPVYLKDIWPSNAAIAEQVAKVDHAMFRKQYADVFSGDEHWQKLPVNESRTYDWQKESTYIQHPPFFEAFGEPVLIEPIKDARVLALFGDSITTDHISPAGAIKPSAPAGEYLQQQGIKPEDFNSYGSRRGNHQVMMRGTFANIRIRNQLLPGSEGGVTRHFPSDEKVSIYEAAMRYQQENTPLIVLAGKEYGTGSSRDWAAKGTRLLGVKAVIAESFERIHRSNLVGMGVLPLQFTHHENVEVLQLTGEEHFNLPDLGADLKVGQSLTVEAIRPDGKVKSFQVQCRIDTENELHYFRSGGILQYVLEQLLKQ
ncbi:aconitate hydratase AcnA [Alkalimonas collagenimarina]|uniref:Aconitate hydratase n=1 Tax=Alkalimonas collagenimarina TaxID=400390 RepID=A0ABT9GYY3_9GAMM|nr:aconitate hydratase AcnA [Alkalimonas collagenimarina]MDP4536247.1 aconitate hydratase AcnA [Alkalimonas collagenimarina]